MTVTPSGKPVSEHIATVIKLPYLMLRSAATNLLFDRRYSIRTAGHPEPGELGVTNQMLSSTSAPACEVSHGNVGDPAGRQQKPALIAGAGTPIGLAIARGLRDIGVPLVGACVTPTESGCRSRLWQSILRVGAPTAEAWLETLHAAHERYGPMVLLAADDGVVRIIAQHAAELATRFDFVMPDLSIVDRLLDKSVFHEWALANDFPVPHTAIVRNPGELHTALREMTFPIVFKPFERTVKWLAVSRHDKVYRFDTAADLDRLPFAPFDAADRFVVQEWIPGRDSDVYFCLTYRNRNGDELAAQVGRKISQWPVDIGTSALAVTHQDAELLELTRRLLGAAGHVGFGSLEVRRSSRDGRMLITEPTVGRPNMQTALAAAAGVNLAEVAYRDALRLPPPPSRPSREAIWIHETKLPQSVVVAARRRRLDARALLATLRTRRAPIGAYFSARDPLPLVLELLRVAGIVFRAALSTARKRRAATPHRPDTARTQRT